MRTYRAEVLRTSRLNAHLRRITVGGRDLIDYPTTGVPDEYTRVQLPAPGADLVLPVITDAYEVIYPDGVEQPAARVYTVSDHRVTSTSVEVDLDVALHEVGIGSNWAQTARTGDEVGLIDPHGLYAAPIDATWQLLVCDLTGVPALARILRGLSVAHTAVVKIVVTDAGDQIDLPTDAHLDVEWITVERDHDIPETLERVVLETGLPADHRYVWLAGEARASRAVRRYLRRELGWAQTDFYTCGYWQIDAATWNARYTEVADEVIAQAIAAQEVAGEDEGAYLDALDDIYEKAGL